MHIYIARDFYREVHFMIKFIIAVIITIPVISPLVGTYPVLPAGAAFAKGAADSIHINDDRVGAVNDAWFNCRFGFIKTGNGFGIKFPFNIDDYFITIVAGHVNVPADIEYH